MAIDLYYMEGSTPSATVRLLAGAIGVDLNLKILNVLAGEHLTPEFLKVVSDLSSSVLTWISVECDLEPYF